MGTVRMKGRRRAGLSLVELLLVLAIIGIISAVAIPTIARTGWFTANKSSLGARELFTVLRAAKVYATTYNVDTVVAYGMRVVTDSETGAPVPVADSVVLARRLTRDEIDTLILGAFPITRDQPIFVPLRSREGIFRTLPNNTCVLPDLFKMVLNPVTNTYFTDTGLTGIQLLDISTDTPFFIEPRAFDKDGDGNIEIAAGEILDYRLDALVKSFPAHRFTTDGSLDVPEIIQKQRFRIRVGMLPDRDPSDRFYVNLNETTLQEQRFPAIHYLRRPNGDPVQIRWFVDPDTQQPVDIATQLLLFRPTGRVKIES